MVHLSSPELDKITKFLGKYDLKSTVSKLAGLPLRFKRIQSALKFLYTWQLHTVVAIANPELPKFAIG